MTKVLLADDSKSTRSILTKILSSKDYDVYALSSGQEVLDKFSSIKPDVVLLDVEMPPGISGIETCIELRKQPESFNVPIAIVSAKDNEDEIVKGLTSGADVYILKPIRKSEVLSKVSLLLSKRGTLSNSKIAENVIFSGHYKITETLGKGGYSVVYKANDIRNGQSVALKVLDSKSVEGVYLSQFLREAYGLSLLKHRNIVKLFEFGNFSDQYFIATEFIDGESLSSIVKHSPVSEHYAAYVASEVLEGLKYLNRRGIVHRDIKPDHILIEPEGRVVIVDFGLAKEEQQHTLSFDGEMQGTPQFMSPEYIRDEKKLTIKVDIYALGVTLFFAVSGESPFKGEAMSIVNDHLHTKPPKLNKVVPFVSRKFSDMISKMLIKDPRRRIGLNELSTLLKEFTKEKIPDEISRKRKNKIHKKFKKAEKITDADASLKYHKEPVPGKISVESTKDCSTQKDLSLAYSPWVAEPCLEIQKEAEKIWDYTAKNNLLAVISDGTAVLGLGNIGAEASMPVMEGKCVLFKKFADIDAFPICLSDVSIEGGKTDPRKFIETVKRMEPSFGGINLEDIAAPACFEIEKTLIKEMHIPVFHDDQHGTAIISLAGVLNALKLVGKKMKKAKFVVNGAGAAGIACAEFYISAGARRENFIMCDSKGVIYKGRPESMTPEKKFFASDTKARTLSEALEGADVFIGLSIGNLLEKKDIKRMAEKPIVFAMANPVPEIHPEKAYVAGAAVVGTGRSDFANQVNNVLGFPGIFRGALDVRAKEINQEMKLAASKALAEIASEKICGEVYDKLSKAYPKDAKDGIFDEKNPLKAKYVIPKPFDPRVVPRVARYVAEAAQKTGTAQKKIKDMDIYEVNTYERINMHD